MLLLYALTMFVSATLLFLVQPMFARMALPLLGGSPAVWNTAMLFYQTALLAGYLYAHLLARRLSPRRQVIVHAAVLLLPLLALPIGIPEGWSPPTESSPLGWLLALLLVAVGLPFFVISTSSPLLQAWFARTGHRLAADPYPLYAASNVGSMLALLTYPTLVEPALGLVEQSQIWAAGYGLLLAMVLGCAAVIWRRATPEAAAEAPALAPAAPLSTRRRARWVLLAFVPSSLMLSVTTYLSTDIAPIPLLWVIPLAIYLLTFILVFSGRSLLPHPLMLRAFPVLLLPLVVVMAAQANSPLEILYPLHLLAFFVATMVCHGELAGDRPPARHLTEFYLWLSVGGALGGVFNAIVAPLIFSGVYEYPLVLALAALLLPPRAAPGRSTAASRALVAPGNALRVRRGDLALPAMLGLFTAALIVAVQNLSLAGGPLGLLVMFGLPAALAYPLTRRPLSFGLGVGAVLFVAGVLYESPQGQLLHAERSFFGVHRVLLDPSGTSHLLSHGVTLHGAQSLDPARSREPLTYYHRNGPAGQIFAELAGPGTSRRVAAIGLGVGSLACYRQPGQEWRFYEIDPVVEAIARDVRFFTFMQQCGADIPVVLGDGRLTIARAPEGAYDLIVLDAYTSDAIPLHLITREALRLYLDRLAEGGVLAFHISNRYFDLGPVLGDLAADAQLTALIRDDRSVPEAERAGGRAASIWVAMARERADLGSLAEDARWQPLPAQGGRLWTDDFTAVLSALRRE